MQSSLSPLTPVPRSPPLGPQNSVALSTMNTRSLPFSMLSVKLPDFRSTALTLPARASLGTSNFLSTLSLSLSLPRTASSPSEPTTTSRQANPDVRNHHMMRLLRCERAGIADVNVTGQREETAH